jgi:vancomycin permeability regulator SanA
MLKFVKFALAVFLFASIVLTVAGLLAHPVKSDIAIVLGNTVSADGSPSPRLRARLDQASLCYRQALCKTILVSGGIDPQGHDEALVMKNYLVQAGIPAGTIAMDNLGRDTWLSARNASAYMQAHHLVSAIVVTQYFHIPRTILAMKRFGIKQVSGSYPRFFEARDLYSIAREVPAFIEYGLRGDT